MYNHFAMRCHLHSVARRAAVALRLPLLGALTLLACVSNSTAQATAATPSPQSGPQAQKPFHFRVTVTDETGVAVPDASVYLMPPAAHFEVRGKTDVVGRADLSTFVAGSYTLTVEKVGFFVQSIQIEIGGSKADSIEVTLPHEQEYRENVQVNYSPPAIDPAQTSSTEELTGSEIIELPYPTTRDVRNALPLLPGILPDNARAGQIHVAGAASNQALYTLDGFDVSQPVSGALDMRVSTDAVRSAQVFSSRYSVSSGWGSGGLLDLETGMGDDHFRFFATDFIPSPQDRRGIHIDNATPRFSVSGPIWKGKAWFYEAVEGEYDYNLFTELPPGADTDHYWRWSNLSRAQVNLTQSNRLTAGYLYNHSSEDHAGLSLFQPLSTTTSQIKSADLFDVKDQQTWSNGMLFEAGFAYLQFSGNENPLGAEPYIQMPGNASGNYYLSSADTIRRYEGLANLYLPPADWHGLHEFLLGVQFERTDDEQSAARAPFTIETAAGVLERLVTFSGPLSFAQNLFTGSAFVQDRWSPTPSLLLEPGVRFDEDDLLHRPLVSPRLAGTWMLTRDGATKLSAGVGLYYDRSDLDKLTRPLTGSRQDLFYAADGVTPLGPPVITSFEANPAALAEPRTLNWSVALERELPRAVYFSAEFLEKRGSHGFDYVDENLTLAANGLPSSGLFTLQNGRQDKYDALTLTLRHTLKRQYPLFFAYTRSRAHSNAALDSAIDAPLFSPQLSGPLPWDSPNRIQSWGAVPFALPVIHALELDYSFDWRTGYPYNVVNLEQELVGLPGQIRFPDFASLNLHVEKRFRAFGCDWALRAGFNNISNRENPLVVDNDIDSPTFGQFSNFNRRAFTGRIRFLGRK
jgi:hypothetical protein